MDNVNNPAHYSGFSNGAEPIDILENLTGNGAQAAGYIIRSTRIDGNNKGDQIEDLQKAIWYCEREINRLKGLHQPSGVMSVKEALEEVRRREAAYSEQPDSSGKTMDEYSPEERAGMIGMWARYDRRNGGDTDFVIIEGDVNQAGRVPCYNPGAPEPSAWAPDPWMLTPRFDIPRAWDENGDPERFVIEDSDEPVALESLADYENAPAGSVVATPHGSAWTKGPDGDWWQGAGRKADSEMAGIRREILRKEWGK